MIRFIKTRDVKSPSRGTAYSAGVDFFIPNDFHEIVLIPGEDILIPSGIKAEIPEHCCLLGVDKSGIASSYSAKITAGINGGDKNKDTALIVGAKLIDADYSGEIHLHIINCGNQATILRPGMKIAQFVLLPVYYDTWIESDELRIPTGRNGGFSSTGIK